MPNEDNPPQRDPREELVIDTMEEHLASFLRGHIFAVRELVNHPAALASEKDRLVAQSVVHGLVYLNEKWFSGTEDARRELRPAATEIVRCLDTHKHDPWETF